MNDSLAMMSATALTEAFAAGRVSPVEAAEAAYARIAAFDGGFNAMVFLCEEEAMAAARASADRWRSGTPLGPVDGVPTTIKDLSLMKGHPTLRGSRTTDPDQPWDEDSPVTARLREGGAVLIGKTTTPEFGWKGVTDSPLSGITRNPWDPAKTCGGSSGGAAVAAAAGFGALHLGGDGGGSIRMPAGFTGIYGLKPTAGRVPYWPASPLGPMSHNGPMTRTVTDAAVMLTVLAQPDRRDWYALPYDGRDYSEGLDDGIEGLKIAFSPDLGYAEVDPEVAEAVAEAVSVLADLGAVVETVPPPFPSPRDAFGILFGVGQVKLWRGLSAEKRALLDPGFAAWAEEASTVSLADFLDAEAERLALGQRMNAFFADWDLLVTPQLPLTAFDAGIEFPEGRGMRRWLDWSPFTYPFNMTGNPAANVPCGFDRAGLPIGLQVVGDRFADHLVLRASRAFEDARPFRMPAL
ncbi:MAG: amidase [Rhodospirillaceae bacterium]|nr:amidase [Rhodospirillaceae bacterium]